ncbi:MAG TPA: ABC transporter ATP-binding protein [Dehalococcoidia bacterium]|nr:ABC transporter ATP-binding protein [Dehalococcoidia bacterium]
MLQLNDIHTYYGDSHILQGVSLKVDEGSIVALLGRNGVGKTTVIRSIIGLTPPRQGTVLFKGRDITGAAPHRVVRMGIGLVPQGRRIFPSLSVKENLTIAARSNHGRPQNWDLNRVLSSFPMLKERLNARGNTLSGGELQMLAIARALMGNPDLLLIDEASEGLAPLALREIGRIIKQLKAEEGLSILLVAQNINLALELSDYVYVMGKGKIAHESLPGELRGNDEVKAKYLGV